MPAQPPDRPPCPPARTRRPLPDPAAVRLCPIPDAAPPYDGETAGPAGPVPAPPGPGASPGLEERQDRAAAPEEVPPPGARGIAARRVPGWPGQFAQVLAETLAGSRPPRQIVPWTTQRAREHIKRLGPQLASRQQPRVRRVVTCQPAPGVLEMAIVAGFGPRVRAVAVRFERGGAGGSAPAAGQAPGGSRVTAPGWMCTAVEAA
jgi:Family of unknown function (DUF6459)